MRSPDIILSAKSSAVFVSSACWEQLLYCYITWVACSGILHNMSWRNCKKNLDPSFWWTFKLYRIPMFFCMTTVVGTLSKSHIHICNLKTCCGCCCCCSGCVTSMAYNCVGWHLHTLPWLSPSPRRISRQNRIVSTFQRVWSEIRRKGKVKESKEWENRRKNSNNSNPNPTVQTTHRGCNVKVENGWSGNIYVVFKKLQYNIWVNLWTMDGNGYMHGVSGLVRFQLLSHSCNEEGLPHARSSRADYPYTGTVCACACRSVLMSGMWM